MKLLLHPGHGKCGSSSIQNWVAANINTLKSQGIIVPGGELEPITSGEQYKVSSFTLKDYLASDDESGFKRAIDQFLVSAEKQGDIVLWSDEFLSDPRAIHSVFPIHNIIKDFFSEIQITYYVRRQDDFILSGWQQWRHKGGLSIEEEVKKCIDANTPDYLVNIKHFESIYGKEAISVRPFNKSFFVNNDLLADFCDSFQLEFAKFTKSNQQLNVSLNPYLCDILSRSSQGIYRNNLDDNKVKNWLEEWSESDRLHQSHKGYLGPDIRGEIMSHFFKENTTIHQGYFPDIPYDKIFGEKLNLLNTTDIEELKNSMAILYEIMYKSKQTIEKQQRTIQQLSNRINKSFYWRIRNMFKS